MKLEDRILEGPKRNVKVKIIRRKGKKKPRSILAEVNYKTKYPRFSEWRKIGTGKKSYVERGDYEMTFGKRKRL